MSGNQRVPGLARHFINQPETAVLGSLESVTLLNPALVLDKVNKIVFRNPNTIQNVEDKISLIAGGGSGHEPAWAGFVGYRFLTAAVAGTVFASPAAEQVKNCITARLPGDSKGVLVIVKNYTGDVLNFGRAVEGAKATGRQVEMIVVGDDVGVGRAKSGKVGRRGLAGTVLVAKICGALAESGSSLADCARIGRTVADNLVTVAVSLSRTHVLGQATQDAMDGESRLPDGRVELGMGIHNEPGCAQLDLDVGKNIEAMLTQLLDDTDEDRVYTRINASEGHQVVLLVNNFGGLSNLELGAITSEVCQQLAGTYDLRPLRVISGTFVGSLDGRGFSITLLKIDGKDLGVGHSILDLLDEPTDCAAWPIGASAPQGVVPQILTQAPDQTQNSELPSTLRIDPEFFEAVLSSGLKRVIAVEPEVTKFDTQVGDGDCGTGLKRGAETILKALKYRRPGDDLLIDLQYVVQAVERSMDGTSGALFAIYLNSLVYQLRQNSPQAPTNVTPQMWAMALRKALDAIASYTPARPGDRTMVDALTPFIRALADGGSLKDAASAAEKGSESTKGMVASLGRTVYVGGEGYKEVPDPGAHGLAALFRGFADAT